MESRWLQRLYEYVKEQFGQTWLPSHDHTHHMRVWSYARNLIGVLHKQGNPFPERKLEQLIIAVFFHDTGLTRTLDVSHGKESASICSQFLAGQSALSADSFDEILDAVEKHDDKSTADSPAFKNKQANELLTMLTVCDDLDAFGAIGVFRYLEIYAHRGIPLQSMPLKIIENLNNRYGYLLQHYSELTDFMPAQKKRFQYTVDFYSELCRQQNAQDSASPHEGPLKVVNLLLEKVLLEKIHFTELASAFKALPLDEFSKGYFRQLQWEIEFRS